MLQLIGITRHPYTPEAKQQKQVNHIAMITFWSQFSVYVLNTILILYLTRPLLAHGLGYSESKAYAFMGVTTAMGYLMPVLGGNMADKVLGLRRSIYVGCILLACAYLLVMLSGMTVSHFGDIFFIAAFALIPVTNSLLMGTASAMVTRIYSGDEVKAKSGMTLYYMAINIGALLATIISPKLLNSSYGPLSVFAVVFIGKAIAALNFSYRYHLYDDIADPLDLKKLSLSQLSKLCSYVLGIYLFTLVAYMQPEFSGLIIATGCIMGITWFLMRTLSLDGVAKIKQLIAIVLIIEAVIFFVLYNQMNTTLILFAQKNSNLMLFGLHVSSAQYQMINPLVIILMSLFLPGFYARFRHFTIPYQFAMGTVLGGVALLVMWFACLSSTNYIVDGNYFVLTYFIMTIAELWVSAVGLSMIGLYCDKSMTAFAMGVWYLAVSLSNILSSRFAQWVSVPTDINRANMSLMIFQNYYFKVGLSAVIIGLLMWLLAIKLQKKMDEKSIKIC